MALSPCSCYSSLSLARNRFWPASRTLKGWIITGIALYEGVEQSPCAAHCKRSDSALRVGNDRKPRHRRWRRLAERVRPMSAAAACSDCGAHVPAAHLACHACGRLFARPKLKRNVAAEAAATAAGGHKARRWQAGERRWLLPPTSRQYVKVNKAPQRNWRCPRCRGSGSAQAQETGAGVGQAVWPLGRSRCCCGSSSSWRWRSVQVEDLSAQADQGLHVFSDAGVPWRVPGAIWLVFGLGLVRRFYCMMGHSAALRRFGIPATPPMFIPGLGCRGQLKTHPQ